MIMEKQAHLGLSLSLKFYLRPWSVSLNGRFVSMMIKLVKSLNFNMHTVVLRGQILLCPTPVNLIESAILRKQLCLVISVDIKGAFDNLAFMAIEKAMIDNNYPPIMIRWFMNFLKNRTAIAEVLGVRLSIRPMCGTPQGGVLSSRIWNLAFDPLLKLLNKDSPCAPVGFADYGALCFRGIDPETLVEIAQPKINQAVEWGVNNGLTFSVDKTTAVFFSTQKKFHSHVLPKLKKN